MSEASQRRTVVRALSGLHAIPVENPVACPGTPDVNYVEGWIELKNLRSWPKRAATIVRIEHFTEQQRRFLRRRCDYGGLGMAAVAVPRRMAAVQGRHGGECGGSGKSSRPVHARLCTLGAWTSSKGTVGMF